MKRRIVATSLALVFANLPALASEAPGEIVALQGKGDYREEKEPQWRPALVKQKLAPASFVRTGELSSMGVLLADRTQIKLGQNTVFQIRAVAGQPSGQNTQLDLKKGKAWSQTKNAGSGLFVKTPSALAGIHGTDWVVEVDEAGKTLLTVFSGVIELSNEYGSVSVGRNEHAEAEVGKAPVKRTLVNPKERVQWVSTYTFSPERYRELAGEDALPTVTRRDIEKGLAAARSGDFATAMRAFTTAAGQGNDPLPHLLAGDLALARGELALAATHYATGRQRFPHDGRFAAGLGRAALYNDDLENARAYLEASRRDAGSALLSALLAGDLARVEGRLDETEQYFNDAIAAAPRFADGWFGRGSARLEVEDVKRSRSDLMQALSLAPAPGYTHGELGTLETVANDLQAAREHFAEAIAANPGDYVALCGLGLLELKAGNTAQAFEHLLAANTIEPRYARGVVYLGVAYYLSGDVKAGLESLQRASELDEKDPLPHLMISLIHQDQLRAAEAIEAAQAAVARMPYLKSLNQVANDQKGSASLGGAVAQFGLENWAMAQAQSSHYPYWGGSHLFLADRYNGRFNKNAELMQGFLASPTVFGADTRRQTLVMQPGDHVAAGLRGVYSKSLTVAEPVVVLNGYHNSNIPVAYFLEMLGDRVYPGEADFSALARNTTFGLGFNPNHETGVFIFGNHFRADIDDQSTAGERQRISGTSTRLDLGLSYRFEPKSQAWLKAGMTDGGITQKVSGNDALGMTSSRFRQDPDALDLQARHTLELLPGSELTYGAESARGAFDLRGSSLATGSGNGLSTLLESTAKERDTSHLAYVSLRHTAIPSLVLQGDLAWTYYRKSIDETDVASQGGRSFPDTRAWSSTASGVHPRLGAAFDVGNGLMLRAAYQSWRRPASFNTLAPTTTAGIVLDDQLTLPGGEQRGGRLQADWQVGSRTFLSGFVDQRTVDNLHLRNDRADNQRQELADLDRLRVGKPVNLGTLETLESRPVFTEGIVRSAGVTANQILSPRLTGFAGYAYTWTENRSDWFKGLKLPWLPRNKGIFGATWTIDGQWLLQGQATYRSERFTDEANSQRLDGGWDFTMKASWRSTNRNVWLEAWAQNLAKPDAERIFAVALTLRY